MYLFAFPEFPKDFLPERLVEEHYIVYLEIFANCFVDAFLVNIFEEISLFSKTFLAEKKI